MKEKRYGEDAEQRNQRIKIKLKRNQERMKEYNKQAFDQMEEQASYDYLLLRTMKAW